MSTAEMMGFSVEVEARSVHVLLWDDPDDLVRALVILVGALSKFSVRPILVGATDDYSNLRQLIESRTTPAEANAYSVHASDVQIEENAFSPNEYKAEANQLWMLIIQQASMKAAGPWLNGWRRPLSEPPGSILVIRHSELSDFNRFAPDLASFVGPRIFDAGTMLPMISARTHQVLNAELPLPFQEILRELPGSMPTAKSIQEWIDTYANK
jgi:hypothetical protein